MTNAKHVRLACVAALLAGLFVTALPGAAQAQRQSPLADAPAIRKRVELRATRGELGVGFGSTIGQDYYHSMFLNLKLGFHLTDWLSISGFGGLPVASVVTGYHEKLNDTLAPETGITRAPTKAQAEASMTKIKTLVGVQLEFTPFTGKYSLFGKLFAHYDFYFFGGVGALNLEPNGNVSNCSTPNAALGQVGPQCVAVSGWKPGGNVGVGLHTFFNQVVALNVELRDIISQGNQSGRDVNGDGKADDDDLGWGHTYMVTGNIVFYLPTTASISP